MEIHGINVSTPRGRWVADWTKTGDCDYNNLESVIMTHRPVLQFRLSDMLSINEATYRDLVSRINPRFLHQGIRSGPHQPYTLPHDGKQYFFAARGLSFQGFNDDTMIFYVTPSTEYPKRQKPPYYENLVRFLNWFDTGSNNDMKPREKAFDLLWNSDIQLHCSDPSFLYWGYKYILSQINASIEPEDRPPSIRNPSQLGICCKHLNRVLRVLPFYNGDIAKALINQFGGKLNKKQIKEMQIRSYLQQKANEKNPDLPPEQKTTPPESTEIETT
jgi:hypothetical protein